MLGTISKWNSSQMLGLYSFRGITTSYTVLKQIYVKTGIAENGGTTQHHHPPHLLVKLEAVSLGKEPQVRP